MSLESWSCVGCTNVLYMTYNGEVRKYCRPMYEGKQRTKWEGDFLRCLNYTTDPKKEKRIVQLWMPPKAARKE